MNPSTFAGQNLDQKLRQAWYPSSLLYEGVARAFAEKVEARQAHTVHTYDPMSGTRRVEHYPARSFSVFA